LAWNRRTIILLLETRLIFSGVPLKIIKEHPVKHRVFRMKLTVDPCPDRENDSRSRPGWRPSDIPPYKRPSLIQALFGRISTEVDDGRFVESTNVTSDLV